MRSSRFAPVLRPRIVVPAGLAVVALGLVATSAAIAPRDGGRSSDIASTEPPIQPFPAAQGPGSAGAGVGGPAENPARSGSPSGAPVTTETVGDAPSDASAAGERSPSALLTRAADAARTVAYQGTQAVSVWRSTGTSSMVVDIVRVPDQGAVISVQGTASNAARAVYASDESDAAAAGVIAGSLDLLAGHYKVTNAGTAVVAGRPADVVDACRTDGEVAARFFLDNDTGLLLRREVFDTKGSLVQESVFLSIAITSQAGGGDTNPPMPSAEPMAVTAGWRPVAASQLTPWQQAGWTVRATLPVQGGNLTLYDARSRGQSTNSSGVLHLSYSDGVSTLSLFQQQGRLDTSGLSGWSKQVWDDQPVYLRGSLPLEVAWSCDGTVFTVLTSVPTDDVADVVKALPHCAPQPDDIGSRMQRGLERVGSWLNPFA